MQYTTTIGFNNFVGSAVKTGREEDEKSKSSVVAETLNLLANSSYGFQTMRRSRHTVTKYRNDENTRWAINHKKFQDLIYKSHQFSEAELVKSEVDTKIRSSSDFSIYSLQIENAIVSLIFLTNVDLLQKNEDLQIDSDSLFSASAEKHLCDRVRPTMKKVWAPMRCCDCTVDPCANATTNSFPHTCCTRHKEHNERKLCLLKGDFRCTKRFFRCSKTYCCYDSLTK